MAAGALVYRWRKLRLFPEKAEVRRVLISFGQSFCGILYQWECLMGIWIPFYQAACLSRGCVWAHHSASIRWTPPMSQALFYSSIKPRRHETHILGWGGGSGGHNKIHKQNIFGLQNWSNHIHTQYSQPIERFHTLTLWIWFMTRSGISLREAREIWEVIWSGTFLEICSEHLSPLLFL